MTKTYKYIKRYGLKIVEFKKIDLRTLFCQYRPDIKHEDMKIINSPHVELADLYYKNGLSWLEKNFSSIKYYSFQKNIMKKNPHVPKKKIHLFDSIKHGYLRYGHEKDYIVILNDPFIITRYGVRDISSYSPEIFMGHHRAGALVSLKINKVEVIIAKDIKPNSCQIKGKLHNVYSEVRR